MFLMSSMKPAYAFGPPLYAPSKSCCDCRPSVAGGCWLRGSRSDIELPSPKKKPDIFEKRNRNLFSLFCGFSSHKKDTRRWKPWNRQGRSPARSSLIKCEDAKCEEEKPFRRQQPWVLGASTPTLALTGGSTLPPELPSPRRAPLWMWSSLFLFPSLVIAACDKDSS